VKKSLIALAALAATASFAQSTATISGSISVGVVDTGAAGDTAQVTSLGGGANAVNIVTSEDLGGGLKAGFDGQIRFSAATGDRASTGNGNALFHGANVYVSGGFGTARIGKIIELNNCAFDPWGCTGGASTVAGQAGTIGASGAGLVGALTIQNAISYATPTIAGFSASYQTSLSPAAGAQAAASATNAGQLVGRTNERQVLSLNYANGPLALQVLSTKGSGNTAGDWTSYRPATSNNSLIAITDDASKATAVSGSYDFGVAKLNLINAVTKTAAGAKANDITTISGSVPMGAYTILAGYSKDKIKASNADTKLSLGVNYALSKRTTLGADVFKQEGMAAVAGTGATGSAGTGYVIRARHTF